MALRGAKLDALELILGGLVMPIDGYCLPSEKPQNWPFTSVLEMTSNIAAAALAYGGLTLTDPDGTPLALLTVSAAQTVSDQESYLSGGLTALQPAEHPPARDIRLTTEDSAATVAAIFTASPDPADIAKTILDSTGEALLLLAVSWNDEHADYWSSRLADSIRRCSAEIPNSVSRFLALAPLNSTVDQPTMLAHVLAVLGIPRVLDFSRSQAPSSALVPTPNSVGCVVLLTGLSGSGKSTIARSLLERLKTETDQRAVLLDGDDARRVLSPNLGFSAKDREENLRRIGWVAAKIASVGGIAICAPIAPFEQARAEMRSLAEVTSRFMLVYVATPLEVCEQRDRKGLYARARAGEIQNFTGIDSPYEVPANADLVIDTTSGTIDEQVSSIMELLGAALPTY